MQLEGEHSVKGCNHLAGDHPIKLHCPRMQSKIKNVAVYTFEVWDHQKRVNVVSPRMGTPDAIRRVKGIADLESKQLVDESQVDANGLYPVEPAP